MASAKNSFLKAAIVTVGTEITDGQIFDRNSRWLSQKLDVLNVKTIQHISIPDSVPLMLEAFSSACRQADLVFISGGLGPTVDDFTRDVISEFISKPLKEDEASLKVIVEKITGRGLTLRDGHRRQALIPEGGIALPNSYGVAPGFYVEHQGKKIWALPGPPKEIEAIWPLVQAAIEKIPQPENSMKLQTWLCLGVAESDIAQRTEDFFSSYKFEKQFGYRIQLPYVEVKLWYDSSAPESSEALEKFTAHIQKHFVAHHLKEAHRPFLDFISAFKKVTLVDTFTQGTALSVFTDILAQKPQITLSYIMNASVDLKVEMDELRLELAAPKDSQITWIVTTGLDTQQIQVPLASHRSSQYNQLYALEVLFLKVSRA